MHLKRTHLVIVCLLISLQTPALFCSEQSSSPSQTSGQNQANPPANPPAAQSAQPADQGQSSKEGQNNQEGQGDKAAATESKDKSGKSEKSSDKSNDRLFFALPNFLTVENAAHVPPLTAGGKFKLVGRSAFDPVQFVWYAALAGISQAENSEPGFGQGAEGYGKRYGAYIADGTIENFMVGAVFPAMLRQDPRFFQSGKGSFFHRTGYAVSRALVTRTDSGRSAFNYSEIFGSAVSSAISTYSYHPRRTLIGESVSNGVVTLKYAVSDRTLKNTASVWGSQVGYDTITFVIKEFWPDIRRKMQKKQ